MGEHPGLSMARWLREAAQESAQAPEDIERYDWYWCAASAPRHEVVARDGIPTQIEPTVGISAGDMKIRARFGMDAEHRIAVLFWGAGGPSPTLPKTWHLIDQLAFEGRALMCMQRKPLNRLKPRDRPKKPKSWQDEGEEWKE